MRKVVHGITRRLISRLTVTLFFGSSLVLTPALSEASLQGETLTLDSHDGSDDGAAGPVATGAALDSGSSYIVTVDGTVSLWERAEWDKPGGCGSPESTPERSSPGVTNGPVSSDAEFLLAEPAWGGHDCNDPIPRHDGGPFQLDVGSGFAHVDPIGGEPAGPAAGHTYRYRVTGQGVPARFQLVDDPTSDNYGVLTINVEAESQDNPTEPLIPRGCVDDNDSGPEECAVSTDGLDRPRSVVVSPDGSSLYAVSELDHAIVHFDRDTNTGDLTAVECIDDNDNGPDTCADTTDGLQSAIEVAISPDGRSVYAVSLNDSAVVVFDRNTTTGRLTPAGCVDDNDSGPDNCSQSTDGLDYTNAVAVSPDGSSVYVLGQFDDAIVHFDRDSSGDLTPRGCIDDNDSGADDCGQSTDGLDAARSVVVSPDGRSVYVASMNDDAVVRFDRNTSTGALTPAGCIDGDSGPDTCSSSVDGLDTTHSVAVSPDGRSVYVAGVDANSVFGFTRSAEGALDLLGCIDDTDHGAEQCDRSTDGLGGASWVAVSPDGRSIFATATNDDAVGAFARNTSTGALSPLGCIDDNDTGSDDCSASTNGLDAAIFLAISPDGEFIYVPAYEDDAIAIFEVGSVEQPPQCQEPDAICGGSGDEDLEGTPEDEFIFGGGGNDTIDGGGGNDVIVGGSGNDVINGGAGKDKITGGAGKDRILGDARGAPAARAGAVSAAQAAASADQLAGGAGNDTVLGQAGNDKLNGDGGNDLLKGGSGVNDFNGGPGKDTCVLKNRKDDTKSCEKKRLDFRLDFFPHKKPG